MAWVLQNQLSALPLTMTLKNRVNEKKMHPVSGDKFWGILDFIFKLMSVLNFKPRGLIQFSSATASLNLWSGSYES